MAVCRVEKSKDYTVRSNFHLKDKTITLKAKGLLSQMLSLPENCNYTLEGLDVVQHHTAQGRVCRTLLPGSGYGQMYAGGID